ncbi:MAG TPA: alpha/beta fold hydrolase [Desulfobacterales bacterium]|nr:alpha/beta fold hydrolase [Desulfobacterales bacterium]
MKSICNKISFLSDNFLLRGILHIPAVEKGPVVIGSHGLLSSGSSPKQIELARRCNDFGIAFFRFDHRGCGKSEGVFKEVTSLDARRIDILSAIETIRGQGYIGSRIGLFGSSMGGAVCISAASIADICSMVVFAAPLRSRMIKRPDEKEDKVEYKKLSFDISGKLYGINNILIFHGDADQVVPFSNAIELYEKAGDTKKLIIQENGDHLMSNKAHQEEFIREAGLWFKNGLKGKAEGTEAEGRRRKRQNGKSS